MLRDMKYRNKKLVYLDYNLYSIFKGPTNPEHVLLCEFLKANEDKIQLVYSDAHLDDLSKGKIPRLIEKDLENISGFTNDFCLVNYWGRKHITLQKRSIKEFYESQKKEQNNGCIGFIKWLTFLGLNKFWQKIRSNQVPKTHREDVSKISNYSVSKINQLVENIGQYNSFDEWVDAQLQTSTISYKNANIIDYYTTAYNTLDLISYYPEKLDKKNKFENLFNDAKHSAYGSQCDAFITNDYKCYLKSKFMFKFTSSKSILIKTVRLKNLDVLKQELISLTK